MDVWFLDEYCIALILYCVVGIFNGNLMKKLPTD